MSKKPLSTFNRIAAVRAVRTLLPFVPRRPYAPIFGGLVLLASVSPAWSSHIGEDLTLDQQAVTSTNQLLGALRQYEAAAPAQQAAALARLTELATQRRERMLALLQRNPNLAAARVLPPGLRDRLPAGLQAQVEREVAVTGTVHARV